MAVDDCTENTESRQKERAKRAAYMREHRKKNPEKYRVVDAMAEAKKKAKDKTKFLSQACERQRRYRDRLKAKMTDAQRERLNAMNRERNRKYRDVNREEVRKRTAANARRYYAQNPEKYIAVQHRRRSVYKAGNVTAKEWREIKLRWKNACAYCGASGVKLEMDHVQPVTKNGAHVPDNVVPACRSCNAKKSNKIVARPIEPEVA